MTWGTITDEGIAEAEALIDVLLRRDRMKWIETTTRDAIRHFARGVGDKNPLWLEPEYALSSPYKPLVAPPCILYALDGTVVAPKLAGVQWLYAGTTFTWFEPILLDDTFRVEARLKKHNTIRKENDYIRWVHKNEMTPNWKPIHTAPKVKKGFSYY